MHKVGFDAKKQVKEFKRTCQQCGKVWHVLATRESKVATDHTVNKVNEFTSCCSPLTGFQASRNRQASDSELSKLRTCPECQSANYKEEVLIYDKK